MNNLFDINHILKNTKNIDKLPVILKNNPKKGNSLYTNRDIKNGEILAYYKMKVYKDLTPIYDISTPIEIIRKKCNELTIDTERKNNETFYQYKKRLIYDIDDKQPILISLHNTKIEKPIRDMYHFTIYKKNGDPYKNLVGDLYEGSLPNPKNNIPYWAYFSNEPSPSQIYNSDIDIQLKENYKDRNTIKEGDIVVYALVANKNIQKGKEVLWCYGNDYHRKYKISKKCL